MSKSDLINEYGNTVVTLSASGWDEQSISDMLGISKKQVQTILTHYYG